ncbi:V-type ATP synthase subunit E [Alkalibacterium sp. AK22]|uniref:V-type ATP synthase subunit E n=1 Tax=Alkalibacterium sp. AK22 TaxID=1229520 RepID=UPI000446F7BB|nr:V-type ATP synthase subunit E [Alkalibacterium sp. AK22]EXJ24240.1 V-type ATP synthase subunit E [Alkalibacterium sp. AK22]
MADLKLLTERIVEKEKAAIRDGIEKAKKEAEDDVQAAEAEAVQKRAQEKEAIKAEYEQEYTIKKNTLEIKRRNDVLAIKQDLLHKVFQEAKRELDQMDPSVFKTFVAGVILRFKSDEMISVRLGEKSADAISQDWLDANSPSTMDVRLLDETVPKRAGLLIEKDGIEYNFLFEALVEDAKMSILPDISEELF